MGNIVAVSFLKKALRCSPLSLSIAGAIGPTLLAIFALVNEIPRFTDPCRQWGISGGSMPIDRNCAGRASGTSETKLGTMLRLAVIEGGMLTACAAGIMGALRRRPHLTALALGIMLLIMLPLGIGRFGILALLSAACFGAEWLLVVHSGQSHR